MGADEVTEPSAASAEVRWVAPGGAALARSAVDDDDECAASRLASASAILA